MKHRLAIGVLVVGCLAVAIVLAYRSDRSGVKVVFDAASGSDAFVEVDAQGVTGAHRSAIDEAVRRECEAGRIRRAFSHCEDALAEALGAGGDANLRWGPHAERLGKSVDTEAAPLDPDSYREAFVSILDPGDDDELIRLVYCRRLCACRLVHCRPSALPRQAADSLPSLYRGCREVGHLDPSKARSRGRT